MNFSEFDVKVLTVGVLALLLVSATAGATPLAGNYGEMPQFENNATVNLSPPEEPGGDTIENSKGMLKNGPDVPPEKSVDQLFSKFGINARVVTSNPVGNYSDLTATVIVDNGTTSLSNFSRVNVGETTYVQIQQNDETLEVRFHYSRLYQNVSTVQWEVTRITLGGEVDAGVGPIAAIAEWLGYISSLFRYAVSVAFGGVVFVFTTITNIALYIGSIVGWISGGYGTILSGSPAWASAFLSIPPLLVGFESMKLLYVTIDILWLG